MLGPDSVARALDEATLLVLPSWPEGLGRVVIEAFARGRGVVATDAGGIPDLVTNGEEGILIPPADEDALVSALVRVLDRPRPRPAAGERGACELRRLALDAGGVRSRVPRAGRAHDRLMRLVFVTQTLDAEHPALAQTLDLVDALAARSDELVVLCASVGAHGGLPANVRVREFGARSRLGRGVRFTRALAAELRRTPRPDAVLAHMVPLFLVLAAPLAKPLGVRLALWYTHWHAGRTLRLATRLADVILSVDRRSFPLDSPKVRGIGHAIDVSLFAPPASRDASPTLRLLALGRTARWKGYETMLAALELAVAAGVDAELELRGPQLTDDERAHRRELEATVAGSDVLRTRVRIEPPAPRAELPRLLAATDALLSATQPRGGARRSTRSSTRRPRAASPCSRATPRSTSSWAACRSSCASRRATRGRSPTGCSRSRPPGRSGGTR